MYRCFQYKSFDINFRQIFITYFIDFFKSYPMKLQTVRWSLQHSLKRIIRVECREIIGMKDFFQHGKWGILKDKRCLEVKIQQVYIEEIWDHLLP